MPYASHPYAATPEPGESILSGVLALDAAAPGGGGFVGAPVVAPQFAAAFGAAPFGALTFGGRKAARAARFRAGFNSTTRSPVA